MVRVHPPQPFFHLSLDDFGPLVSGTISNDGGRVKSVLILFLPFSCTPLPCAGHTVSDSPFLELFFSVSNRWLGPCHFIKSVSPTNHLFGHSGP